MCLKYYVEWGASKQILSDNKGYMKDIDRYTFFKDIKIPKFKKIKKACKSRQVSVENKLAMNFPDKEGSNEFIKMDNSQKYITHFWILQSVQVLVTV